MKEKILNLKWRYRIEEITPDDCRIGTDILLIEDANAICAEKFVGNNPFKIDMSMAIIYESGEAVSRINMRKYHIKAPAVLIVMHGQTCELLSYSDNLRSRAIVMSRSFTDSLFVGTTGTSVHDLYMSLLKDPHINFETDSMVFGQYYKLLRDIAHSPHSNFKTEAARHLTLAMFYGYSHLKHQISNKNISTSRQEEIYLQFIDLLDNHYSNERQVLFYADRLCITAKHLSQVVKNITGKTALAIIDEYVITEAKALLLSTTMSIQQISDRLNFPSQSVFGKYFKRCTSMTPKECRMKL
jgi:AraC-like DNA-binding protein